MQRLLSYNTCYGFQILRSDNFSWLLHLSGTIELEGSKSRGIVLLAGEFSNLVLLLTRSSRNRTSSKMMRIDKLLLFVLRSDKALPFHIKKWQVLLARIKNYKSLPFTVNPWLILTGEHLVQYSYLPATKFLLSASKKLNLLNTFNLKNYMKTKTVEHQGPILYPWKSFAALQNLARLSL